VITSTGIALGVLMLAQALPAAGRMDICEQRVPASLKRLIDTKFPGFRLPRLSDQDADITKTPRRSGCLIIARGDFDGDGRQDIALLLVGAKSNAVRLVAGLRRDTSLAIYPLPTWCETIRTCYVQSEKLGLFKRTEALDMPLSSPDEREEIESRTENVLSGTLEATGIIYVYSNGKWHYVWISN